MRLNPSINPINTEHVFKMRSGSKTVEAIYAVMSVTATHAFTPEVAEPVVYLRLNRRTALPVDNFIALPLSAFVAVSEPFGKTDVFWVELEKTDGA